METSIPASAGRILWRYLEAYKVDAESQDCIDLMSEVPDVPEDAARVIEDGRTSVLLDLCRKGLDKALDPVAVDFTYPEPKSTGDHFGAFRCRLSFSQPLSKVSFNIADARRPFTATNRELAVNSDQILEGMLNLTGNWKAMNIGTPITMVPNHDLRMSAIGFIVTLINPRTITVSRTRVGRRR